MTKKYIKKDYICMKVEINCTGSDAILDPFGGSGTSIIACEKLNRTAYVNEIDPRYCDVIRKRWTKWAEENGVNAGAGALD